MTRFFYVFAFILLLFPFQGKAQFNQWAWMAGDNITNQAGNFGVQGVAAATNKPPAFYEGGGEWTDAQGKFWHFGAGGFGNYGSALWKFDPVTNMWTWVKGPTTGASPGVWGTKGVAAAANNPSGRAFASATWIDQQGNFWLFGGYGYNTSGGVGWLDDMWKYDPIANMWTWMGGSNNLFGQPGVYGTKGVAAAANYPAARCETDAAWVDGNNKFWLFAGLAVNGNLNDMWKYDPITNQWTWMHGSNITNQPAVYGTKGVAAATNVPGNRMNYASWKDIAGNFWIFGSRGSAGQYDDLWKFDPNTVMWTWMKGAAGAGNTNGTYGTKCVDGPNNNPPALYENRARWSDDCGNLWLWGGNNHNDLWRYSQTTGNWTWVSGSNAGGQVGNYGAKGVFAATNIPGVRCGNLAYRRDNVNELWFIGGGLPGDFNDVWKYIPDKPTASFTFNPNNACAPAVVAFTNTSIPGCNEIKSSSWNFGDPGSGANNVSVVSNPSHTFVNPGSYTVKLVVTNCTGSKDSTTQVVTVINCGTFTASIQGACTKMCLGGCQTVQVVVNGGISPYTYNWTPNIGTGPGVYNVCPTSSTVYSCIVTDSSGATASAGSCLVTIFPTYNSLTSLSNPGTCGINNGTATASATGATSPFTYSWSNGQTIQTATGLSAGNYSVTVTDANGCTKSTTIAVTNQPGPTSGASGTNILCNGGATGTATASGNGGTGAYTYVWSNNQSTQGITGLLAGNYTVTVKDANGCTSTSSVVITQPAAITTTVTVTAATCTVGGTATISANGGGGSYTYLWSNGQTASTATGLAVGNYTVTVSDLNNCTVTATAAITGTPVPTGGISSIANVLCNGGSTGSATASGTGGTGTLTYTWNNGQTTTIATGLTAGSYTVTIKDSNGCTVTASVGITEPALLVATANGINACANATASGSAVGGSGSYTYLWNNGQTTQNATGLVTGVYTLVVSDANGCTAQDTATINVSPPPVVVFTADDTSGCAIHCVNFTCSTANVATYTWDFGDLTTPVITLTNTVSHCYKVPGIFNVILNVADNNGCTASYQHTSMIEVYPNVLANFSANPQPTTILNANILFTDLSSNGANTWNWIFYDDGKTSILQNPSHTYKDSGCFNVELIANNKYNCPDTITQQICIQGDYELFAPNAFTPDGDGLNDVFLPMGVGIDPGHFEMYVFDRWGNLIFKTTDLYQGWNGKANGGKEIAQQDVYVWKIFARDMEGLKHSYIGHVSLIR